MNDLENIRDMANKVVPIITRVNVSENNFSELMEFLPGTKTPIRAILGVKVVVKNELSDDNVEFCFNDGHIEIETWKRKPLDES